jgi:hypothetical protein
MLSRGRIEASLQVLVRAPPRLFRARFCLLIRLFRAPPNVTVNKLAARGKRVKAFVFNNH